MKESAKEFSLVRVFGTLNDCRAGLSNSYVFYGIQADARAKACLKHFLMVAIARLYWRLLSFTSA